MAVAAGSWPDLPGSGCKRGSHPLPAIGRRGARVSLHRVDPRFVLPHRVSRAVVLDGLEEWRAGCSQQGSRSSTNERRGRPPDVVVSPARLAAEARHTRARSIIVEGSRERSFRGSDYPGSAAPPPADAGRARRWRCRSTSGRPCPTRWNAGASSIAVGRRARMRAARALVSRGLFPSWASPVVTVATRAAGPPTLVAAAAELGVPSDVRWFLTFGQGDALSRNAFQLFRAGSDEPEWVLKFARVAGYSERFDNDERGLRLAHAAGDVIAAHAPRLVGRFDVDGVHASLETAAAGRRLRDVLLTPGDRAAKLKLIERIGGWILELGRLTQTSPEATGAERERLRSEVLPRWSELGVPSELVDELPPLAAVAQHNDLGTWNVVADDGDFVVVDWENAREAALPLWDLLYFLGDAFVLLDGSDCARGAAGTNGASLRRRGAVVAPALLLGSSRGRGGGRSARRRRPDRDALLAEPLAFSRRAQPGPRRPGLLGIRRECTESKAWPGHGWPTRRSGRAGVHGVVTRFTVWRCVDVVVNRPSSQPHELADDSAARADALGPRPPAVVANAQEQRGRLLGSMARRRAGDRAMGERPRVAPGARDADQGSARTRRSSNGIPPRRSRSSTSGAGPLTALGFRYPGKTLTIVPVDPLADEYDRLLRDAGLDPPIRTIRVAGEALLEHFGSRRFDIAYASNALDHSADPFTIISNMVAVVRPGGIVLLRHKRNEGESARYGGLHQWNFDVVDEACSSGTAPSRSTSAPRSRGALGRRRGSRRAR